MTSQRLTFRTRGGPTQGWGNIFRLASFAGACRDAGFEDVHFLAEGPVEVATYLRSRGFGVTHLADEISLSEEAEVWKFHGPSSVVFVEMLDITSERQALLQLHGERLVIFDDLCDHIYDADLVVCGQALPSHANRALSAPRTRFLTGPTYFLCRPEFLPYADRDRRHRQRIEKVLVTLGGGTYDAGYLKAALALRSFGPELEATFVLGYGKTALDARIRDILPSAMVLEGGDDLEARLWDSDVAITSAGYTKFEAAITRTPFLMMSAQWHQIPLAESFSRASGVLDLGYMAYVEPCAILQGLKELNCPEARRIRTHRARSVVDGRGFERVLDAVFRQAPLPSPRSHHVSIP